MAATIGEVVFVVIWVCLVTPPAIYFILKFYRCRQKYPLKGRFPALSLMGGVGTFGITVYYSIIAVTTENGTWSCVEDDVVIMSFVLTPCLISMIMRIWILFFQFRLIPQQLAVANRFPWVDKETTAQSTADREWFVEHQYLIKPKFLTGATIFYFVWRIICYVPNAIVCREAVPQSVPNYSSAVLLVVFIGLILGIIRHPEGRFIKTEFKMLSVIAAVHLIIFASAADSRASPSFTVTTLIAVILVPFYFAAMIVFPLRKVQINRQSVTALTVNIDPQYTNAGPNQMSLNRLLDFDDGQKSFTTFLEIEFAVENILFWGAIRQFKARYQRLEGAELSTRKKKKCAQDAVHIYNMFISRDARLQVNLSANIQSDLEDKIAVMRKKITISRTESMLRLRRRSDEGPQDREMENQEADETKTSEEVTIDGHIFDAAFDEILSLMEDPFFRYLTSPKYGDLKKQHPSIIDILQNKRISDARTVSSVNKRTSVYSQTVSTVHDV